MRIRRQITIFRLKSIEDDKYDVKNSHDGNDNDGSALWHLLSLNIHMCYVECSLKIDN